ncbi:MAG TPA: sugar phosphate nucleotidyltransferase, partial [Candidatus Sulfotelmatobacter sp.]|nr:sugar phosphate nucleotidyltransferase [Candidatus Sulfotelmatobacter sp.]
KNYLTQKSGARIMVKEVNDPKRFGVVEMKDGKVLSIEEKPKKPKSTYAVTGIYFYDTQVFSFIKNLKPSHRGELEITDVNNAYLAKNDLAYDILSGWWSDAGTFESLEKAALLVERKIEL